MILKSTSFARVNFSINWGFGQKTQVNIYIYIKLKLSLVWLLVPVTGVQTLSVPTLRCLGAGFRGADMSTCPRMRGETPKPWLTLEFLVVHSVDLGVSVGA